MLSDPLNLHLTYIRTDDATTLRAYDLGLPRMIRRIEGNTLDLRPTRVFVITASELGLRVSNDQVTVSHFNPWLIDLVVDGGHGQQEGESRVREVGGGMGMG